MIRARVFSDSTFKFYLLNCFLISFLSYFTNLTFTGLCAYFFASSTQTFLYYKNLKGSVPTYPLRAWPRPLRCLHTLLLTTVITFREQYFISGDFSLLTLCPAFLVTIVYWTLLASSSTFANHFSGKFFSQQHTTFFTPYYRQRSRI